MASIAVDCHGVVGSPDTGPDSRSRPPEETLFTLQVAPDGASVAAFYANFKDRSSSVVTYAYPSWRVLRRVDIPLLMPRLSEPIRFNGPDGSLLLTLEERTQDTVAVLRADSTLTRVGTMGGPAIIGFARRTSDMLWPLIGGLGC